MNADLLNILNLFNVVDTLKLLWEMFKNFMVFKGGKFEEKIPFKELFGRSKKDSEVRDDCTTLFECRCYY